MILLLDIAVFNRFVKLYEYFYNYMSNYTELL